MRQQQQDLNEEIRASFFQLAADLSIPLSDVDYRNFLEFYEHEIELHQEKFQEYISLNAILQSMLPNPEYQLYVLGEQYNQQAEKTRPLKSLQLQLHYASLLDNDLEKEVMAKNDMLSKLEAQASDLKKQLESFTVRFQQLQGCFAGLDMSTLNHLKSINVDQFSYDMAVFKAAQLLAFQHSSRDWQNILEAFYSKRLFLCNLYIEQDQLEEARKLIFEHRGPYNVKQKIFKNKPPLKYFQQAREDNSEEDDADFSDFQVQKAAKGKMIHTYDKKFEAKGMREVIPRNESNCTNEFTKCLYNWCRELIVLYDEHPSLRPTQDQLRVVEKKAKEVSLDLAKAEFGKKKNAELVMVLQQSIGKIKDEGEEAIKTTAQLDREQRSIRTLVQLQAYIQYMLNIQLQYQTPNIHKQLILEYQLCQMDGSKPTSELGRLERSVREAEGLSPLVKVEPFILNRQKLGFIFKDHKNYLVSDPQNIISTWIDFLSTRFRKLVQLNDSQLGEASLNSELDQLLILYVKSSGLDPNLIDQLNESQSKKLFVVENEEFQVGQLQIGCRLSLGVSPNEMAYFLEINRHIKIEEFNLLQEAVYCQLDRHTTKITKAIEKSANFSDELMQLCEEAESALKDYDEYLKLKEKVNKDHLYPLYIVTTFAVATKYDPLLRIEDLIKFYEEASLLEPLEALVKASQIQKGPRTLKAQLDLEFALVHIQLKNDQFQDPLQRFFKHELDIQGIKNDYLPQALADFSRAAFLSNLYYYEKGLQLRYSRLESFEESMRSLIEKMRRQLDDCEQRNEIRKRIQEDKDDIQAEIKLFHAIINEESSINVEYEKAVQQLKEASKLLSENEIAAQKVEAAIFQAKASLESNELKLQQLKKDCAAEIVPITKADFSCLRSLRNPPIGYFIVCQAYFKVIRQEFNWSEALKYFRQNNQEKMKSHVLQTIKAPDLIILQEAEEILIQNGYIKPETAKVIGVSCYNLCKLVTSTIKVGRASIQAKEVANELMIESDSLENLINQLQQYRQQVQALQDHIQELTSKCSSLSEKQNIIETNRISLDRFVTLVSQIDEWSTNMEDADYIEAFIKEMDDFHNNQTVSSWRFVLETLRSIGVDGEICEFDQIIDRALCMQAQVISILQLLRSQLRSKVRQTPNPIQIQYYKLSKAIKDRLQEVLNFISWEQRESEVYNRNKIVFEQIAMSVVLFEHTQKQTNVSVSQFINLVFEQAFQTDSFNVAGEEILRALNQLAFQNLSTDNYLLYSCQQQLYIFMKQEEISLQLITERLTALCDPQAILGEKYLEKIGKELSSHDKLKILRTMNQESLKLSSPIF